MRNLLLLFQFLVCTHLAFGQVTSNCTAFSTNGLAASQYQYYRFYDFRHVGASKGSSAASYGAQSKVVTGDLWENDWYIRNYPRKSPGPPSIPVNFITEKVYITNETNSKMNYTSYLSLNTERVDSSTQDAGEITFQEFNVSHASFRVYGRVHGAPGAIAGIFTYLNDTQESDIEIFTRAPAQDVQYSNQPSSLGAPTWADIPGATVNVTMPQKKVYTDWHVHRLDWTPGRSVFFVDDVQTNTTTLQVPVASPPSGLYIDMWSANSTWSGSMDIGKNATFDIMWVEIMFNTTQPVQITGAQRVCNISNGDMAIPIQSKGTSLSSPSWIASLLAMLFIITLI